MVNVKCMSVESGVAVGQVSLKTNVFDLKKIVAEKTGENVDTFDVIYCGKKLNDETFLENVKNLNENSTLFVFSKPKNTLPQPLANTPTMDELDALLSSLKATLVDPHTRALLNRVAGSPETLQNLIDCVPGLRQDTVAQAVVKDPFLLHHWVDDENATQLFTKHPSLFVASQQIVEHLHAEVTRHSGAGASSFMFPPPPPDVNVGGFEDDDDDDDDEDGQANQQRRLAVGAALRQQITAQQLATALAVATGVNRLGASATAPSTSATVNRSVPPSQATNNSQRMITPDMFRQAIQQAVQSHQPNYEAQMNDLKAMGFSNDDENLRALRASNGNVQAALEFIINERERLEQGFGLD